jgi:hypothetical protein
LAQVPPVSEPPVPQVEQATSRHLSGRSQGAGSTSADAPSNVPRVGWGFIVMYALSYTGGSLLFLAPLLVSLAVKVNDLVGIDAAPRNLPW